MLGGRFFGHMAQNQRFFFHFWVVTAPKPSQNALATKNWSIHFAWGSHFSPEIVLECLFLWWPPGLRWYWVATKPAAGVCCWATA